MHSSPSQLSTERVAALREEQARRWEAADRVPIEELLRGKMDAQVEPDALLDLIYAEVLLREQYGEKPSAAEYVRRFPALENAIRRQFEVHAALATDSLLDSQSGADNTDRRVVDPNAETYAEESPGSIDPSQWPRLPGYEIVAELGRGGMGVVYQARQLALNRFVALKMIRAGVIEADELARFRSEAEAVAQLHHPHIVQIHEMGDWANRPYFSLELVEGGSLDRRLAGQPQQPEVAARVCEILARTIHTAHERGIVHRDLKPANVLLDTHAPTPPTALGTPKITDFGLAQHAQSESDRTAHGTILGTPSYMPPEQTEGRSREFGSLVDVYSLGAILYEMLTGRPPFRGPTVFDTLDLVRTQEPVGPSQLQPSIPRDIETICLKCLRKEPTKRYASAFALAEDLRRFLNDEPIHARPAGVVERLWRSCRRNPRVAVLTTALAATFIAGFVGMTFLYFHAEEQRGLATERENTAIAHLAEAVRQRHRADANLIQAVDAVEQYYRKVTYHRKLKEADFSDLRKELLGMAVKFYTDFVSLQSDAPDLRFQQARAYSSLALITSEVASKPEALAWELEATKLLSELVRAYPTKENYARSLAISLLNQGVLHRDMGRAQEAVESYRKVTELLPPFVDRPAQSQPFTTPTQGDSDLLSILAKAHNNLFAIHAVQGNLANARADLQRALSIHERLACARPSIPGVEYDLARTYVNLGALGATEKDYASAVSALGYAEKLIRRLDVGANADYQELLAFVYTNLATAYSEMERTEEAEAAVKSGIEVQHRLVQRFPSVTRYQVALGNLQNTLGKVQVDQGATDAAIASYGNAIATLTTVLEKEPQYVDARRYQCAAHFNLGIAHTETGKYADAQKAFDRALVLDTGALHLQIRLKRALARAIAGDHAQAVADARAMGADAGAYDVARIYGAAAGAAAADQSLPDADRRRFAQEYAANAVHLLQLAKRAGYFTDVKYLPQLRDDPAFETMRSQDSFQEFVRAVEASLTK